MLTFGAVMLLSVIVISVSSVVYFSGTAKHSIINTLLLSADNNAEAANDFFRRINLSTQMLTSETSYFSKLILTDEADIMKKVSNHNLSRQLIKDIMDIALTESIPYYRMIYFADDTIPSYDIFQKYSSNDLYVRKDYNASTSIYRSDSVKNEDWYKKAMELGGEMYWFKSPLDDNMLCAAKRLTVQYTAGDMIAYRDIGTVFISFDISWISDRITTTKLTERSSILLYTGGGSVVYTNNTAMTSTDINDFFSNSHLERSAGDITEASVAGKNLFLRTTPLSSGLTMATLIPTGDIDAMVRVYIYVIAVIAIIVMLLLIATVMYISKRLSLPINNLSNHMLSNKSFEEISCKNIGDDEIGAMYKSYNILMCKVNELISQLKLSAEKEKRATFNMLQAQINPHFIYNSLDSVCCMLLIRGEHDTAQALSNLANIMRYNIKEPDAMVPLQSELTQIENYMTLQTLKLGDKISLKIHICDAHRDYLIPKMILQPLVENCVNHAFDFIDGQMLCIEVGSRDCGELVELYVADNGKCDNIDEINDHIKGLIKISKRTGGLGACNVNQRIQMCFGEEYHLVYCKNENGCTKATVKIPKMKTE